MVTKIYSAATRQEASQILPSSGLHQLTRWTGQAMLHEFTHLDIVAPQVEHIVDCFYGARRTGKLGAKSNANSDTALNNADSEFHCSNYLFSVIKANCCIDQAMTDSPWQRISMPSVKRIQPHRSTFTRSPTTIV